MNPRGRDGFRFAEGPGASSVAEGLFEDGVEFLDRERFGEEQVRGAELEAILGVTAGVDDRQAGMGERDFAPEDGSERFALEDHVADHRVG